MSRDRDREDERDDCKIFIGGIGRDTGKKLNFLLNYLMFYCLR